MEQERIIPGTRPFHLPVEELGIHLEKTAVGAVLGRDRIGQKVKQRPGLRDALLRLGHLPGMVEHHVAGDVEHVPAGIGVVAHVGHAIWGQVLPADGKDLVAHAVGDPGIDAVRDDVVELAQAGVHVHDVQVPERDVVQPQRRHCRLALGDLARGIVYAHELALRQAVGHGDEVASAGAAQLQHPAALDGRRAHPQQRPQRRQPVRMALRVRQAGIRHLIVAILNPQFSILHSQFSILNSQFPIRHSPVRHPSFVHSFIRSVASPHTRRRCSPTPARHGSPPEWAVPRVAPPATGSRSHSWRR